MSPLYAPQQGFTYFRKGGITNGTATAYTAFYTDNALGSLSVAYKMIVTAWCMVGANGAANKLTLAVWDETGTNIHYRTANSFNILEGSLTQLPATDTNHMVPLMGIKDYAAGVTCGFRLAYKVTTSNIYIDAGVKIDLVPQALINTGA